MKTVDHSYEQALIMHDNVHIHVIMNIIVTPSLRFVFLTFFFDILTFSYCYVFFYIMSSSTSEYPKYMLPPDCCRAAPLFLSPQKQKPQNGIWVSRFCKERHHRRVQHRLHSFMNNLWLPKSQFESKTFFWIR